MRFLLPATQRLNSGMISFSLKFGVTFFELVVLSVVFLSKLPLLIVATYPMF
jgi:hypothetical protein